jgi:hypothetical protein
VVRKFDVDDRESAIMQRLITRDVWESDLRVEPNWWLKESGCDYCMYRNSRICDQCSYNRRPLLRYQ